MFGKPKEGDIIPKKSVMRGLKKLILVSLLFLTGAILILGGFGVVEPTPQLLKYTGAALLVLAALYHFVY